MEKVEILIIGAGVVGLSIAKKLSEKFDDVVVVEREESFGRHTSSRNSEVIHSGIYYPQNTLKAKLCVRGADLLYDFARENNVKHEQCGKFIVATSTEEIPELEKLQQNGELNGVKNMRIVEKEEIREMEPQIHAIKALEVKKTGIIDTHGLMRMLAEKAEENDAFIVYKMEVTKIEKKDDSYIVQFSNGEIFQAQAVINSTGLFSDEIAKMVGIDIQKANLKLHWCKGEYYKDNHISGVKRLIYPLPDPKGISLGIHLTINLNGEVRFGPNAYYIDELDYKMDETNKKDFLQAIQRYITIEKDHLHLDDCGIRPKLQGPNDDFRDFYIKEESTKGFPNFINLIGIESPGLTCCLAIAEKVALLLKR